jgi:hypothetical protein
MAAIVSMLVAEDKFVALRFRPRSTPWRLTLTEGNLFALNVDFAWARPAIPAAEDDVIPLDFAHFRCSRARLLPAADRDVCLVPLYFSRAA